MLAWRSWRSFSARSTKTLTGLVVPKSRRPKFDLTLRIIDLNNVPLVSGTSFIKWYIQHSAAAEHRGRTAKFKIKEHKVSYDYEKTLQIRLTIDKSGTLQELWIHFEVLQEYSATGRGERISLGLVKLNLAEYIEDESSGPKGDVGEDAVTRRYLMQESKINSTLKIGIQMKQVEGDKNFTAPPLKSAPVFGGIAGIMAGDQEHADDPGHMPSLSTKSREQSSLQDMYRRTLAAYWTAQPGELAADECIEDIFAGGSGWGDQSKSSLPSPTQSQMLLPEDHPENVATIRQRREAKSSFSDWLRKSKEERHHERHSSGESIMQTRSEKRKEAKDRHSQHHEEDLESMHGGGPHEIEEDDMREDLRSWSIAPSLNSR